MYLHKQQAEEILTEYVEVFSAELKLKLDFLLSIGNDNDWSFIIKSHALIEAVITELIISRIEEIEMKPIIERMPLHDDQVSKMRIVKIYGLMTDDQIKFVKKLSEIRNDIVHKFDNIDFTFTNYISQLDKNQRKSWTKLINWYDIEEKNKVKMQALSLSQPSIAVWISLIQLVSLMVINIEEFKGINKIEKEALITVRKLLDSE